MTTRSHAERRATSPGADEMLDAHRRFGNEIHFFTPSLKHYETSEVATPATPRFVPVSVTGSACSLHCDHCGAKILESMWPVSSPGGLLELGGRLASRGVSGILLTGGSDPSGVVPLRPYEDAIRELKARYGFTVIVHTGLVDRGEVAALARAGVDAAMMDVLGADDTIKAVYHLDAGVADFEKALRLLTEAGIPTAPHVVVGIHYGKIVGEFEALEMISRFPISSLVVVVLSPLLGTKMERVAPLTGPEVSGVFRSARTAFPNVPVLLGCARPEGREKYGIDRAALEAGFDGIAFPAEGIVSLAREMGLRPVFSLDCCALAFRHLA